MKYINPKILLLSLVLLLVLHILCGCTGNSNISNAVSEALDEAISTGDADNAGSASDADNTVVPGLEYLGYSRNAGSGGQFFYYRDTLTDVIYVLYREKAGYAGMGGLTVMLDPETGLPLTVARWAEFYNQKNTEVQP